MTIPLTKPAAPPKNNKYARFFAILKQTNANGLHLTKEQAVSDYTTGRTTHLSSLTIEELNGLEQYLSTLITTPQWVTASKFMHNDPTRDGMRKAIISQFKSIGRTTKAAIAWAEKYGVGGKKKKFNDYDEQELYQLIRNAEKVKEDFITASNRPK